MNLNRKSGQYSRIERKLVKEIKEIKDLILYQEKITSQKFYADWESSSLLCHDRNNYIRLGILVQSISIEDWIGWIIIDYFIDQKKYSYRMKKYKIFETYIIEKMNFYTKIKLLYQILRAPPEIKSILDEIRKIRNTMAHTQFPGLERNKEVIYKKGNILNLINFKKFIKDCEAVTNFLMNKATGLKI